MRLCNIPSWFTALTISSSILILILSVETFISFLKFAILLFMIVIEFTRLSISFLIVELKEEIDVLNVFRVELIDVDNLFSLDIARNVSIVKLLDTLSILVCKFETFCETSVDIKRIDADVFVDNKLVAVDTFVILFDNIAFSCDCMLLILVLKLTIELTKEDEVLIFS